MTLEKDKYKYSLNFTSATSANLDAGSKVVVLSKATHGTCKYEIRNESGGLQGDFELALGTNEANPQHVEKMMLLGEHMKNIGKEQPDVKHKITQNIHQLHELGQCPNLTIEDINKAMEKRGIHSIASSDEPLVIEKDGRKFSLKFIAATHKLDTSSKVVMTKMLSELSPGKYTCKYEVQSKNGGLQGDFELALEK